MSSGELAATGCRKLICETLKSACERYSRGVVERTNSLWVEANGKCEGTFDHTIGVVVPTCSHNVAASSCHDACTFRWGLECDAVFASRNVTIRF